MVLKSKVTVSPQTCFVCLNEQQQVIGYLISHPYHKGSNLNHTQYPPVTKSIHLHLHDLTLDPTAQEKGLLRLLSQPFIYCSYDDDLSIDLINFSTKLCLYNGNAITTILF
ncbi:hypothetical protein [Photobacterium carnosum]|uniref:hypothetical protein n=1 Tax=Photobacterium carnosum TaxID=2023717 RepID=UPI001181B718|nr:hypothetical protein [Photobacterium carnosum]